MKHTTRFVTLLLLTVILASMLAVPLVQAGSSQTNWNGTFPSENARLNQTLLATNNDNYAEVSLAADMNTIVKDVPNTGQYQFNIGVAAAANSRRGWGYTVSSGSINWFSQIDVHTITLGPDSGYMLDLTTVVPNNINYYGFWYSQQPAKLFISSNGFVVLDSRAVSDNGAYWTSHNPCTLPSTAAPPTMIAPFWRHLKGGTIKYGTTDIDGLGAVRAFFVSWEGIPNFDNSNTETFAVVFSDNWNIKFVYKSVTNDETTSIGLQDQTAKRGYCITNQPSNNAYFKFQCVFPGDACGIDYIKISASKTKADGSNDNNGQITIYGVPNAAGNIDYPGGINVEQETTENNAYSQYQPVWSAGKWVLSGLSLAGKTLGAFLGPVGFLIDTYEFVNELCPVPKTEIHNADTSTKTAYSNNLAYEYGFQGDADDASVFATFVFIMTGISYHALDFNVEVGVWEYGTHVTITLPQPIHITVNPTVYDWLGRTNPDGHYYNFYQISTPYGTGYHIDTIGSSDYGYAMLGWNKLIMDAPEDYKVGTDGKIRVTGYFRQSDTFVSSDQPGQRLLNLYIIYSDNLNAIATTVQVLDYTAGTTWQFKALIIDLGIQNQGRSFKIGVGRPDMWLADWSLAAEWANVMVSSGDDHPPYAPSQPSGPSSACVRNSWTYSTSTTDPDGDNVCYQFDWNDGSTFTTGYYKSGAVASASHSWSSTGTYYIEVRAKDIYGVFGGWSSKLTVAIHQPTLSVYISGSGTTNCSSGSYSYGTIVTIKGTPSSGYYFAYWYVDGSTTNTSNPITLTMNADHSLTAYFFPNTGGGCPILYTYDGKNYQCEGLLNIHNAAGIDVTTNHTLTYTPGQVGGVYNFEFIEHPETISHIDQVKLYAVLQDGRTVTLPLVYAWHSEYGNVLPQLLFADGWKMIEYGANWNNGVSQSIQMKFLTLPPNAKVKEFIFQIKGCNTIIKN